VGGPAGWVAVMLSCQAVLALSPGFVDLDLGVVARTARAPRQRSSCAPSSERIDGRIPLPEA
jgi:hypothetical protein